MALLDAVLKRLQSKGWLSLSTLFFDCGYTINVFTTGGDVAYSPGEQLFFSVNALDSTCTVQVQNQYAQIGDRYHIGQQQILTITDGNVLQHFSLALYAHSNFFADRDTGMALPSIPTEAELAALTKDPDTGLYSGTDTLTKMDDELVSVLPIYPDLTLHYSGALIDGWKAFYENHAKFLAFVKSVTGYTDVI